MLLSDNTDCVISSRRIATKHESLALFAPPCHGMEGITAQSLSLHEILKTRVISATRAGYSEGGPTSFVPGDFG